MKKFSKLISLLCVGAMLFSSMTVFADEATVTGDGALENATTTNVSFDTFVVPTMPAGTYDFTLDPQKLLNEYDPAHYPTAGTFYFKSVTTPATIANKDNEAQTTDGKLYVKELAGQSADLSALQAAITVANSAITDVAAGFSLWVPDADALATGGGEFLAIDETNIANYFDIVLEATAVTSIDWKDVLKADASVCDGKLYADVYTEITPATFDVTGHVKTDVSPVEFKDIYIKLTDGTYELATTSTVEYTEPESTYNAKSDVLTIESKSTKAKTVTATVTVENGDGLTFTNDDTFAADTAASVCLAVVPGTGDTVYVGGDAQTATLTFDIEPATFTPITYRGEVDDKTGGHLYHQYAPYDITSSSVSFYLEGASNGTEGAKEAWDAYAEYLRTEEGATKPGVKVIYKIEDKAEAVVDAAPTFGDGSTIQYSLTSASDIVVPYTMGSGAQAAETVTDVVLKDGDALYSLNGSVGTTLGSEYLGLDTTEKEATLTAALCATMTSGKSYQLFIVYDGELENALSVTINCVD